MAFTSRGNLAMMLVAHDTSEYDASNLENSITDLTTY